MKNEKINNLVTTVDNTEHPIEKCILYEDKYYLKGTVSIKDSGQAYRINNTWKFSNFAWDNSTKKYVDIEVTPLAFGIINKDKEKGFFSDIGNSIIVKGERYINSYALEGPVVKSISPGDSFLKEISVLECGNFINSLNKLATFADKNINSKVGLSKITLGDPSYYGKSSIYHGSNTQVYSLNDFSKALKIKILDYFLNWSKLHKPIYSDISKKIPFSVGIEFETYTGVVEDIKLAQCGLFPLKDGSISGIEYVSLPYAADNRLIDNIVRSCLHLVNFTASDHSCSLHVHFGNLPKDRMFILSLYKLWYELEGEMNMLNIINKRNFKFINSKKSPEKDHCQPIPDLVFPRIMDRNAISEMYAKLISVVNGGKYPDRDTCPKSKTSVYTGKQKWNIAGRYFTLNVLNYLFGNGTVEFRLHKGTVNPYKVVNYILILNAILQYSQKYSSKIFNVYSRPTLKDVLYSIYGDSNLFNYLYEYVEQRKNEYFKEYSQNSNNLGGNYIFNSKDFAIDNIYEFQDSSGLNILKKDDWLLKLGPFEKSLPFGESERFPFCKVHSFSESEEMKEDKKEEYSYIYNKDLFGKFFDDNPVKANHVNADMLADDDEDEEDNFEEDDFDDEEEFGFDEVIEQEKIMEEP